MIQFFKSLPYHIKAAFKSIFRHMALSISAASAVTVTLVLVATFMLVALNISNFTRNIEDSVKIHVKIEQTYEDDEIAALGNQIHQIDGVSNVQYSDKDSEMDAFLEYIQETGGTPSFYESYRGENNPLRDAFIIEVDEPENIEQIAEEIRALDGVETAEYGGASAKTMLDAFDSIRAGGAIFIIALSVLAMFLISNTIKMTIYARMEEISIMRNVGAANWFIKTPFMIEGMVIGLAGAILPILFTIFGYNALYNIIDGVLFTEMFALYPTIPFTLQVSGILALMGMLVGLFGSFFSVNKYLRWKR